MKVVTYARTRCPDCGHTLSRITSTWHTCDGKYTMRYHHCLGCDNTYTSREDRELPQRGKR